MESKIVTVNKHKNMEPKIEITEDGSDTLIHPLFGDSYHSIHGAQTEAQHIFIKHGLNYCKKSNIKILEVGFGSGVNALLTKQEADKNQLCVDYTAIELYPIPIEVAKQMSFASQSDFLELHEATWSKTVQLNHHFSLKKLDIDLLCADLDHIFDIVYFDAFAPTTQPELWSSDVFSKIFDHMSEGGILVTYSVQGDVRRRLKEIGFEVYRLDGPPGKRHILRAIKPYK